MKSPIVFFLMKILALVILLVLGWEFCWWGLGVKPLTPWRLKGSLRESPEEFTLVDVRTAFEYELFHIPGSNNKPNLLLHPELFKAQDPRKPLVIICMTGHRSSVVAYGLKKRGLKVYNLTLGMLGWLLSGGKTVKEKKGIKNPDPEDPALHWPLKEKFQGFRCSAGGGSGVGEEKN